MQTTAYISTRHNEEIINLTQAKKWLRMDVTGFESDNEDIEVAINAAISRVEAECNLSLGVSEYSWYVNYLPCDFRDAKYVKEIVSVTIGDTTVDPDKYKLIRTGEVSSAIQWKEVSLPRGETMTIVFRAGFGADSVPEDLKLAIRAFITSAFDSREDRIAEKKSFSDKLMGPYRECYAG